MTKLLEKAVATINKLDPIEQDVIAQLILDEVESEQLWDEKFAKSPEKLKKLADHAWAEHLAGNSEPLDPEKL